jgi:hypothetical protein
MACYCFAGLYPYYCCCYVLHLGQPGYQCDNTRWHTLYACSSRVLSASFACAAIRYTLGVGGLHRYLPRRATIAGDKQSFWCSRPAWFHVLGRRSNPEIWCFMVCCVLLPSSYWGNLLVLRQVGFPSAVVERKLVLVLWSELLEKSFSLNLRKPGRQKTGVSRVQLASIRNWYVFWLLLLCRHFLVQPDSWFTKYPAALLFSNSYSFNFL